MLFRSIGNQTTIGIRPEHLKSASPTDALVTGKLDLVEQLGEYALVHLTSPSGVEFIAKMTETPDTEKGTELGFVAEHERVHFFENE